MGESNNGSVHSKHGVETAPIATKTSFWRPINVGPAASFIPLYWLIMREIISNIIGHDAATSPPSLAHPAPTRLRPATVWPGTRSAHLIEHFASIKGHVS
jgi:hypothetical protein